MSSSWSALLQVLQQQRWIDSESRAISLEIAIYNVNVNLFTQIKMTVEMPASGGVFPFTRLNVNADCLRVKTGKTQMFSHETILRLRFCFCGRFFFLFKKLLYLIRHFFIHSSFYSMNLYPSMGSWGMFIFVLYFIWMLAILFLTIKDLLLLKKHGLPHLSQLYPATKVTSKT